MLISAELGTRRFVSRRPTTAWGDSMGAGRSSRPLGHVRRALVVAIVGGLLAAACGSGSDDDSGAQGANGETTDGSALDDVLTGDSPTTIAGDAGGAPQATVAGGGPAP